MRKINQINEEQKKTIQEILTLRYSKNWSNSYPSLSSNDFIEGISITDPEKFIEDSIQREIREKIGTGQTNVGIALSSGIDSTLVLALTRKEFPSINIETVSVKFSNSVDETSSSKKISNIFKTNHHILEIENFLEDLGLERSNPTTQIEHYDNMAAIFDCLSRINTILIDFLHLNSGGQRRQQEYIEINERKF